MQRSIDGKDLDSNLKNNDIVIDNNLVCYFFNYSFEDKTNETCNKIRYSFYIRNKQSFDIKNTLLSFYSHFFVLNDIKYPYAYLAFFDSFPNIYEQNKYDVNDWYLNWIKNEHIPYETIRDLKDKYRAKQLSNLFQFLETKFYDKETKENVDHN